MTQIQAMIRARLLADDPIESARVEAIRFLRDQLEKRHARFAGCWIAAVPVGIGLRLPREPLRAFAAPTHPRTQVRVDGQGPFEISQIRRSCQKVSIVRGVRYCQLDAPMHIWADVMEDGNVRWIAVLDRDKEIDALYCDGVISWLLSVINLCEDVSDAAGLPNLEFSFRMGFQHGSKSDGFAWPVRCIGQAFPSSAVIGSLSTSGPTDLPSVSLVGPRPKSHLLSQIVTDRFDELGAGRDKPIEITIEGE